MSQYSGAEDLNTMFSQPLGPGCLFDKPPYHYRGAEDILLIYKADAQKISPLLPPEIEVPDDEVICSLALSNYPFSAFGPYREISLKVKAAFRGREFMYSVAIYADNAAATAVGRELWGFGKKDAHFRLVRDSDQMVMHVDRPTGHELLSGGMRIARLADPDELASIKCPSLSLRIMPGIGPGDPPSLCQLISINTQKHFCRSASGDQEFWAGAPSLQMKSFSQSDPLHLFAPHEFLGAWYSKSDFALNYGTLIHDYLA